MLARITRFPLKVLSRLRDACLAAAFVVFDYTLPVRDDCWSFCTWDTYPHTLDNPRALFEEVKDDPGIRKIILQKQSSGRVAIDEGKNVHFIRVETFAGAFHLARSRVVVIGYAVQWLSSFSRWLRVPRHAVIQLWHGIPLKRIGRLFPGEEFWDGETPKYAATVCSSEQDREMMVRAFAPLPRERVWPSGLPRNDLILKDECGLPADYREHLAEIDRRLAGRRLVLYAPTWRAKAASLDVFSAAEERQLEQLMNERGAVLGIRGHANVRSHRAYAPDRGWRSIIGLNDIPDVNIVLRRADVLVTDYSSIYIDYLLLDRPVLHYAYDLETYIAERGFLYDLDAAFGGACAQTFAEFLTLLGAALDDPASGLDHRRKAFHLFHSHGDDPAAEVRRRIEELLRP